tara:strand:+ start:896 stop:1063 length:168 start_codon:yes stop_codon:yes gene_type:complete
MKSSGWVRRLEVAGLVASRIGFKHFAAQNEYFMVSYFASLFNFVSKTVLVGGSVS